MNNTRQYTNFRSVEYCRHCGWYLKQGYYFYGTVCPDCGEDYDFCSGRYILKTTQISKWWGLIKTTKQVEVGFELKENKGNNDESV